MTDTRIQLRIEADKLAAWIALVPGAQAGAESLAAALESAGVRHGIDVDALQELARQLAEPEFAGPEQRIATGTPALDGVDGELRLEFDAGLLAGAERADDSLDFLERQMLKPAHEGQRIAQLSPPAPGRAGVDVLGEVIPAADGKSLSLVLGDGVESAEEGAILATSAGVILYQPGKSISVVKEYRHSGDVDLRTGNLDMEGSLHISGSVTRNLTVHTSGDCEVGGDVDGGSLIVSGAALIRGRVHRGEHGRVSVGGDVSCRHVEGGEILAGGILRIQTDAIAGDLHAHAIEIGRRVMGGELRAEAWISIAEAGSAAGGGTRIAAGVPIVRPVVAAREAQSQARHQRASRRDRGGRVASDKRRSGRGPRSRTEGERGAAAQQRELRGEAKRLRDAAEIRLEVAHGGVQVSIGDYSLSLEEPVRNVRFRFDAASRKLAMEDLV